MIELSNKLSELEKNAKNKEIIANNESEMKFVTKEFEKYDFIMRHSRPRWASVIADKQYKFWRFAYVHFAVPEAAAECERIMDNIPIVGDNTYIKALV